MCLSSLSSGLVVALLSVGGVWECFNHTSPSLSMINAVEGDYQRLEQAFALLAQPAGEFAPRLKHTGRAGALAFCRQGDYNKIYSLAEGIVTGCDDQRLDREVLRGLRGGVLVTSRGCGIGIETRRGDGR